MKIECLASQTIITAEEVGPAYRADEQSPVRRKISWADYENHLQATQEEICNLNCGGGANCKAKQIGNPKIKDLLIKEATSRVASG